MSTRFRISLLYYSSSGANCVCTQGDGKDCNVNFGIRGHQMSWVVRLYVKGFWSSSFHAEHSSDTF